MLMVKRASQDEEFLKLLPSKWWVKFFKKFDEIEDVPQSKWKPVHHLSYLTKRYEDIYGKRFSFSLKGSPSKCTEVFMIKRLMAVLGTSNQRTIKEYIDWVYDKKVIPEGRRFRSVGFFVNSQFCNEFHLDKKEKQKITRSTPLPPVYQTVIDNLDMGVMTYGELAFVKQALDQSPESKSREPYKVLFKELYRVGFTYNMLEGIK
jgi:hypothetical protein